MYRFAVDPRWILMHTVVIIVVALFAVAGFWQLDRLSQRREHNAFVETRREMPVASLADFFDHPDKGEQRRVKATGRFDVGREVILRGRSNEGRPGNHVLTPLVMSGGRALIVDRGWVPSDHDSSPVVDALPPGRSVEVTGIVLPSEGRGPLGGGTQTPTEAVSRIDVARIGRGLPYRTFPAYLVLQQQEPKQRGELPRPVKLASVGEGPHLLYALQWFGFIPIALVVYGAILRREARKRLKVAAAAA